MKKKWAIILALMIGFAFAMLFMSILIYFGYCDAYRTNAAQADVSILGLIIYKLTRVGEAYSGSAVGLHMGLICGICMLICLGVERLIHKK